MWLKWKIESDKHMKKDKKWSLPPYFLGTYV